MCVPAYIHPGLACDGLSRHRAIGIGFVAVRSAMDPLTIGLSSYRRVVGVLPIAPFPTTLLSLSEIQTLQSSLVFQLAPDQRGW